MTCGLTVLFRYFKRLLGQRDQPCRLYLLVWRLGLENHLVPYQSLILHRVHEKQVSIVDDSMYITERVSASAPRVT